MPGRDEVSQPVGGDNRKNRPRTAVLISLKAGRASLKARISLQSNHQRYDSTMSSLPVSAYVGQTKVKSLFARVSLS